MANKVSSLTFRAGKVAVAAADDGQQAAQQLTILKTIEVESRYAGWIHCFLTDSAEATAIEAAAAAVETPVAVRMLSKRRTALLAFSAT